jgi:hypothetical protein
MSYDQSLLTYKIQASEHTEAKKYIIEISLTDTFAPETLYYFTVRVLPNSIPKAINNISSNNMDS